MPQILLLDEPTVGLDAQIARAHLGLHPPAAQRARAHRLVTTHYIEEVEGCDRVCIIDRGTILAHDTPDGVEARTRPGAAARRPARADADRRGNPDRLRGPARRARRRRDHPAQVETTPSSRRSSPAYGGRIRAMAVEKPSLEKRVPVADRPRAPRPGRRGPRADTRLRQARRRAHAMTTTDSRTRPRRAGRRSCSSSAGSTPSGCAR